MIDLSSLNEEQKEAVLAVKGPVLVFAGAGSGKTRVITYKIAYLLDNGVKPSEILGLTFTNKAAAEMRERILNMNLKGAKDVWLLTFHSFCARILRDKGHLIGIDKNYTIIDEKDKLDLIEETLKDLNLSKELFSKYMIANLIENYKSQLVYEEEFPKLFDEKKDEVAEVILEYAKRKKKSNLLDFNDLLLYGLKLLKATDYYANKFSYILVDEYQDVNKIQYLIFKELSKNSKNITVVGDDDQCVLEGQKVLTTSGFVPIEEINENTFLHVAKGWGKFAISRPTVVKKDHYEGKIVEITLQDGTNLRLTPNHRVWVKYSRHTDVYHVVLKYSKRYGYRLAVEEGLWAYKGGKYDNFVKESCDKLWIIDTCFNKGEAVYRMHYYSLKYQIPILAFRSEIEDIADEWIYKFYNDFNSEIGAEKLFEDKMMFEEYPHLIGVAKSDVSTIAVVMFGSIEQNQEIQHFLEVLGQTSDSLYVKAKKKDYEEIIQIAKGIKATTGAEIFSVAQLGANDIYIEVPASHVKKYMQMPLIKSGKVMAVEVDKVELKNWKGYIYDLQVDDYHNFIVENVIVHNSIYSWRGADFTRILDFQKDFPDAKIIKLVKNYRSTSSIINAAANLIENNMQRADKRMQAVIEDNEPVEVCMFGRDLQEAEFVVDLATYCLQQGLTMAVLYRTSYQSAIFEKYLRKASIPIKVVGEYSFFARKEIKILIDYLRASINPNDLFLMLKILNVPKRGIGAKSIEKLRKEYVKEEMKQSNGISLFTGKVDLTELLKKVFKSKVNDIILFVEKAREGYNPIEMLDLIIDKLDYYTFLRTISKDEEEYNRRVENVKELLGLAYSAVKENRDLRDFTNELALLSSADATSDANVNLMTIHASKGLEFDVVVIVGAEEDLLPHRKSIEEGNLEEERRLFYVAMTRAKKKLYITSCFTRLKNGGMVICEPSRFLEEISNTDSVIFKNFVENSYGY